MDDKKKEQYFVNLYKNELQIPFWKELVKARMENKTGLEFINTISRDMDLSNKKIIEIGSGWGNNLTSSTP